MLLTQVVPIFVVVINSLFEFVSTHTPKSRPGPRLCRRPVATTPQQPENSNSHSGGWPYRGSGWGTVRGWQAAAQAIPRVSVLAR